MLQRTSSDRVYRVAHMFCGIGAGAKGFNDANARIGHVSARFECAGGIDNDAGALRNFETITGAKATHLDLFDREQYEAFHGRAPDPDWREASPADVLAAFGPKLDVMFLSAPCKGFSGLLSAKASGTEKYQALNRLTLRGVWLTLEAYKNDPIRIILFENVPRIATRGRSLLDRIEALLRAYGYVFAETAHDCGEIGGLAQSRKRFLLVARHAEKVPPFLYQPTKSRLRGVGEVIGLLPLPGLEAAGPMHRVPSLQWKTWVRLAFVRAGADWRSLNELRVEDGVLADYGIMPEQPLRDNALGVCNWADTGPCVTSQRAPGQGRFSVADPRPMESWHNEVLGVRDWADTTGTVAGASRPMNGSYSVADPRPTQENQSFGQYGVKPWEEAAATVTGQSAPGGGPNSVADPRVLGKPLFNNVFRIVPFDAPAPAVSGPGGAGGGIAVADPRPPESGDYKSMKYKVTRYQDPTGSVIAASTTGTSAFAVADPRPTHSLEAHHNKMRVVAAESPAPTVTGSDRVGSGALSVADPRTGYVEAHKNVMRLTGFEEPAGTVTSAHGPSNGAISVADPRPAGFIGGRDHFEGGGHYGVIGWTETAKTVSGSASHDNGFNCVADPRESQPDAARITLPAPNERLIARIVALDGTWHRPFTTLELAALQSLFDPGEVFALEGGSDQLKREWIGNAVPSAAARGMAETIGETLLLADLGETFMLSSRAIWTKPLALALAVDPRQATDTMDAA